MCTKETRRYEDLHQGENNIFTSKLIKQPLQERTIRYATQNNANSKRRDCVRHRLFAGRRCVVDNVTREGDEEGMGGP
jgi:hypothetical protein